MADEPLYEMQPPRTSSLKETIKFRCILCDIEFTSNEIGPHAAQRHGQMTFVVTNIKKSMNMRRTYKDA